jgi:TrmH family RNA methyltransferase
LRERAEREASGLCFVEGIRQVLSAIDGGHRVEEVLLDPARLRSDVAWEAVARAQSAGATVTELRPAEFERISTRDNPVGVAAIIAWRPVPLDALAPTADSLYLIVDDVHDAGNLGTLIRTADGAGCTGVVVHSGVDPAHPAALRAGLGTTFRLPVHSAVSLDDVFDRLAISGITTVATSAHATQTYWDAAYEFPLAAVVGNEGAGLSAATLARCGYQVRIPMLGTATSLNVSVAAGIVLYELARRHPS